MPRLSDGVAMRRCLMWACLVLAGLGLSWLASAQSDSSDAPHGVVLTIDGSIGPATSDYFQRGLERAVENGASLVILELDTPGGLVASMRDMIGAMLASPVPVVSYVSPAGARAASAGTYLLYASHVAAMAPATHLGSATPVQLGGGGGEPTPDEAQEGDDQETSSAMERKVLEDAVATIRSLAERHGRNARWAERAVREAANLTANEALEANVIEIVANDLDALLTQLDGRRVVMDDGTRTLSTDNMTLERQPPDWRARVLAFITDPNVAYFLMIIGFYGLIFELLSPGTLFPGVVGAICLVLAMYAFQVLSVGYAGLVLIFLGMALVVAEAFVPSIGVLGFGGLAAFVAGSVMLMDDTHQALALPLVGGVALVAAGFLLWVVMGVVRLREHRPQGGQEEMIGQEATVLADFQGQGKVMVHGERWQARCAAPVARGQRVRIVSNEGLTLVVEPMTTTP